MANVPGNQKISGSAQSDKSVNGTVDKGGDKAVHSAPKLTPEVIQKISDMRTRIQGLIGQVVMVLAAVPRYRHHTLSDLHHLVVEPLMRDRVAIASSAPRADEAAAGSEKAAIPAIDQLAGIAFWASVSADVDAKIREQIKAGVFPVRLKASEWASGDTVWLLDVIAPSQKLATAVLANFRQVIDAPSGRLGEVKSEGANKKGEVKIHPVVARQVDPELLKKMGAVADAK